MFWTLAFWEGRSLKRQIIDTDLCRGRYFIQFPFKSGPIVGESKLKPDYAHSCQIWWKCPLKRHYSESATIPLQFSLKLLIAPVNVSHFICDGFAMIAISNIERGISTLRSFSEKRQKKMEWLQGRLWQRAGWTVIDFYLGAQWKSSSQIISLRFWWF